MRKKKVAVVGVPLDIGAQKLGVDMGPIAIRYAGLLDAFELNKIEYKDFGDLDVDTQNTKSAVEVIKTVSEYLAGLVNNAINDGYIPVILGGDHSVSIGSIAGASQSAEELGVLWFDFHPDANTPETSPSGNIHGMPVAISLGYGYEALVNCAGFKPKMKPENICIIGTHDMDEAEKDFLDRLGVQMYTLFDIDKHGIHTIMKDVIKSLQHCDKIHLSFDVDVLDTLIAPGTGIVSKGGLSYREASYIMERIEKENIIASIDIIEVNPLLDIRNMTAELSVELLLSVLGGSFGDYERNYLLKQMNR